MSLASIFTINCQSWLVLQLPESTFTVGLPSLLFFDVSTQELLGTPSGSDYTGPERSFGI